MSFPNNFIIKAIGVTTAKNIIPITSGDTILPKKIPNLNHSLFNGVKIFELIIPKIKNTIEIINDQYLISLPFKIGYKPINKKTTKKTVPKLLLDPILMS
tara:strand:+ start:150 stop:449 length:300 start_codon:yes stop_codon:yes gene_type:complete